jgi:hypothetical protein
MAKNIEFSAEEMSELHAFYTMEMEKAELRLKAIKSIIAKIGSTPQKRGPKPSVQKQLKNEVNSELVELNKTKVAGRKPGRPAKVKTSNAETKIVKRRGRPSKVKSEIVTLDSITNADVISVPKKRGPKPGAKYKKTAAKKTRVSKSPKTENKKSVSVESSSALLNVQDSPKKRGPKPGTKYKKATTKKTRVAKTSKVKLAKIDNAKAVSVKTSEASSTAKDSSKKRGPKPGAKYTKRTVEAKPSIETKIDLTVVKNEKSASKKPKLSKLPKTAKKVGSVKSSEVVESKPAAINNEIKALKLTVAKLTKPKAVKVTKAVVVKQAKAKAVKVNNSAKKSPVVKVKAPAKVVSKDASIEPQA